jgi:hypothetical protein
VRVSDDELALMKSRAHDEHMPVSRWLRVRLALVQEHSHPRRLRHLSPEALESLRHLSRIGCNLHQIARWQHLQARPLDRLHVLAALRQTDRSLAEVRALLLNQTEEAA